MGAGWESDYCASRKLAMTLCAALRRAEDRVPWVFPPVLTQFHLYGSIYNPDDQPEVSAGVHHYLVSVSGSDFFFSFFLF